VAFLNWSQASSVTQVPGRPGTRWDRSPGDKWPLQPKGKERLLEWEERLVDYLWREWSIYAHSASIGLSVEHSNRSIPNRISRPHSTKWISGAAPARHTACHMCRLCLVLHQTDHFIPTGGKTHLAPSHIHRFRRALTKWKHNCTGSDSLLATHVDWLGEGIRHAR